MTFKFIENAKQEFHRLWTIRVGLFFGAFNGAMIGFAAFNGYVDPYLFLAVNVFGWMALIGARLLHQPGANPDKAGDE